MSAHNAIKCVSKKLTNFKYSISECPILSKENNTDGTQKCYIIIIVIIENKLSLEELIAKDSNARNAPRLPCTILIFPPCVPQNTSSLFLAYCSTLLSHTKWNFPLPFVFLSIFLFSDTVSYFLKWVVIAQESSFATIHTLHFHKLESLFFPTFPFSQILQHYSSILLELVLLFLHSVFSLTLCSYILLSLFFWTYRLYPALAYPPHYVLHESLPFSWGD